MSAGKGNDRRVIDGRLPSIFYLQLAASQQCAIITCGPGTLVSTAEWAASQQGPSMRTGLTCTTHTDVLSACFIFLNAYTERDYVDYPYAHRICSA